jgi:hypothetical protein
MTLDEEWEQWALLNQYDVEDRQARRIYLAGAAAGERRATERVLEMIRDKLHRLPPREHRTHYAQGAVEALEDIERRINADSSKEQG